MGTWDELDTEVNVNLDTVELDELIEVLGSDPIFEPAVEIAQRYKNGINPTNPIVINISTKILWG